MVGAKALRQEWVDMLEGITGGGGGGEWRGWRGEHMLRKQITQGLGINPKEMEHHQRVLSIKGCGLICP